MQECWRWFGPEDPVSLADIRQAGATGVVTALHELPNGTVWPVDAIRARREMIEAAGLTWAVVESIPVHEEIKIGAGNWRAHADAWAQTVRNLAAEGITTICYNFMPVLDWTRTELNHPLPDGALALRYDHTAFAAFDMHILAREGACTDYDAATQARAKAWMDAATDADVQALTDTILAGLPGAEESYTLDSFRAQLDAYCCISGDGLFANLTAFLKHVLPVADEVGVVLAIHPDDPPYALFGLPRIVSTMQDLRRISEICSMQANGFTLCTGSLGVRADNDLLMLAQELGPRIHFAHLRAVRREEDGRSFFEDSHLGGDVDMVGVMQALMRQERADGRVIPMRPDHGHRILSDLAVNSTPGYPAIGRLRGLAELRGVARTLQALDPDLA
ncbi:mannonate dehydratase [Actibacterium mucosum KCTC 23349]|uniref:Mannonate dehydratase n=1 Tax=Actibacterium mucosum KCTC 23349 TaxID=1454373 RepID=A0A037ZIQ1_9RHOB|nr:mannonate dehydratase [Actibacterium mucosum]KAJ55978.1 mannonate dehydratase [Actibacterium mucosum KCTC 23349]